MSKGDSFDLNYYSLIFNAIRLFPDFKEKMLKSSFEKLKLGKKSYILQKRLVK